MKAGINRRVRRARWTLERTGDVLRADGRWHWYLSDSDRRRQAFNEAERKALILERGLRALEHSAAMARLAVEYPI